jgi:transcriptional regulator with XRE-family HTH domain
MIRVNCIMVPLSFMAPGDVARDVAARARARRVALGLTQQDVADRSGVNIWTLRRFEASGKLAFDALIRLAIVLDAIEGFGALFPEPAFHSLEEVIERPKRQRGKRRTVVR